MFVLKQSKSYTLYIYKILTKSNQIFAYDMFLESLDPPTKYFGKIFKIRGH